jgi:uncharacterized membrane protein YkvA (DUF1232 family)
MAGRISAISRKQRRRGSGLLRAARWLAFVPVASRVPVYARLVWALALDARVPAARKALLVGAAGYVLLGRDLVPDELPVIGGIDDLAVAVLAVEMFLDGIPQDILDEKLDELAIDRDAFRRDMEQVRRLTPTPVRKLIRRLPDALDAAGRLASRSRIGPMIRSRTAKEDSFA